MARALGFKQKGFQPVLDVLLSPLWCYNTPPFKTPYQQPHDLQIAYPERHTRRSESSSVL
jgi:hypothetical protein